MAECPEPSNSLAASELLEAIPGVFVHRADLWQAIKRSVSVKRDEQLNTLHEAAVIVRDRTRENGRATQSRTVSRTVLVKDWNMITPWCWTLLRSTLRISMLRPQEAGDH